MYSVEPDLKSFVYCNGIRFGSAKDWEKVFSRFIEADLHTEKELLMKGLGCTNNVTSINKYVLNAIFFSFSEKLFIFFFSTDF